MVRRAGEVCIDSPELLTRREQLRDAFATGLMWALYAYLWLPLISLIAWILGFEFAYDVMVRAGGAANLRTVLYWYGVAITAIFVVFGIWSLSNRLRFSHQNRRGAFERVEDQSFLTFFGISAAELGRLRESRSLTLELDAAGAIREIAERRPDSTTAGGSAGQRRHEEGADEG